VVISIRYIGGAIELRSFLCCQTLLDVYTVSQHIYLLKLKRDDDYTAPAARMFSVHRQNVKGTSVLSMRVTLYLHSATTCIQNRAMRVRHFGYPTRPVPVLLYPYPSRTRDTVPALVPAGKNTRLPVSRLWSSIWIRALGSGDSRTVLRSLQTTS